MISNIAGCVILYNPDVNLVKNNIITYLHKIQKLYIIDNSENKNNELFFKDFKNIVYVSNEQNEGLSVKLNYACKRAISEGYDYLLTMDQDSCFLEENINQYLTDIENFNLKDEVAMYGLQFNLEHKKLEKIDISFIIKDYLITSGSIICLNKYKNIGGFDENLFIDGVDIDYCFNAISKGFKIIEFQNNFFKHSLGEVVNRASILSFFLVKKRRVIHSFIRIYYMQRNLLYLEKKYKNIFPLFIDKIRAEYLGHLTRSTKYSSNYFKAIYYKRLGIKDFKNNKMGKFSH